MNASMANVIVNGVDPHKNAVIRSDGRKPVSVGYPTIRGVSDVRQWE
jgi:hypothetical protein